MYEKLTDRAHKVMQFANQGALHRNHEYIGTEHILLGLIKEDGGVVSCVLKNLGIDRGRIRQEVDKLVERGPTLSTLGTLGKLPQTPRARKVVEYSIEEARSLGHNYIGTEHILLGLLREQEGVAAQVLLNLGMRVDVTRTEIQRVLAADSPCAAAAIYAVVEKVEELSEPKQPALDPNNLPMAERLEFYKRQARKSRQALAKVVKFTLRDRFAIAALQGLLADGALCDGDDARRINARDAYAQADECIAARTRPKTKKSPMETK